MTGIGCSILRNTSHTYLIPSIFFWGPLIVIMLVSFLKVIISNLRSVTFSHTILLDSTNDQGTTINTVSNDEI